MRSSCDVAWCLYDATRCLRNVRWCLHAGLLYPVTWCLCGITWCLCDVTRRLCDVKRCLCDITWCLCDITRCLFDCLLYPATRCLCDVTRCLRDVTRRVLTLFLQSRYPLRLVVGTLVALRRHEEVDLLLVVDRAQLSSHLVLEHLVVLLLPAAKSLHLRLRLVSVGRA